MLAVLGHLRFEWTRAPGNEWNDVRLAPSAGWLEGLPLYTPRDTGTLLGHVYGPLSVLFYAPPVAVAQTPMTAIRFGVFLGVAALLLVVLGWARAAGAKPLDLACAALALLLLGRASVILWSILYTVHPDTWAIAWGLAGCGLASRALDPEPKARGLIGAGTCFAVAIGCKQTMVLAPLGALVVIAVVGGRRAAAMFLGAVAATGIVLIGLVSLYTDPIDMVWTAIYLPSQHPWRDPGGWRTLLQGGRDLIPRVAPIGIGLLAVALARRDLADLRPGVLLRAPWSLPLAVAIVNVPTSLIGRAKIGGDMNSLAYSFTFVPFALLVAMVASTPHRRVVRTIQTVVLVALLVAAGNPRAPDDRRGWLQAAERVARGFAFAVDHPKEIYFPFHPLITYYSDGHFYHASDALSFRKMAGVEVPEPLFFSRIPENLRWVATARPRPDAALSYLHGCAPIPSSAGLEGWQVHECDGSATDRVGGMLD